MSRSRAPLLALLLLPLFATLRAPPLAAQASAAERSVPGAVALPAELDRVLRDYERAWRAGDAAALAALFTPDGFVLQPGRAPARGRAAIQAAYQGQGGGALRLWALGFGADGIAGYIVGAYGYGEELADQGKFTLTLRRGPDGRWLIFSDMDNAGPREARRPPPESSSTTSLRSLP